MQRVPSIISIRPETHPVRALCPIPSAHPLCPIHNCIAAHLALTNKNQPLQSAYMTTGACLAYVASFLCSVAIVPPGPRTRWRLCCPARLVADPVSRAPDLRESMILAITVGSSGHVC